MLNELDWTSLQERREHDRLTMMYKIHNNHVHLSGNDYINQVTQSTRATMPHSYKMPYSRTESHRQSFFPRTVQKWNSLPSEIVIAPSVGAFRSRLTVDGESG